MSSDESWLLGGDFNLLPPSDDPARLGEEGLSTYADSENPIDLLEPLRRDVSGNALGQEEWRTYLSFGDTEPDRRLDYLLAGERLEVVEARVMNEHSDISDHMPILATFRIR
jgi:endonuclease/exonuclease/phosphatase family metal-dependent hydrolase